MLGGFNEDDSDWSAYTPVIVSENIGVAATIDKISSAPYKINVEVPHHHILNSRDPFANPPSFEIVNFYNTPAISMPTSVMAVDLDSSLSNGTATFMGESSGSIVDAKVIFQTLALGALPNTGTYKMSFYVPRYPRLKTQVLTAYVRACVAGEILTAGSEVCIVCEPGTYSIDTVSSSCKLCPLGAVCRGGNQLKAISGYWRPSNASDEIQPCREPSACLGAIPPSILQQHRGPEFYGKR